MKDYRASLPAAFVTRMEQMLGGEATEFFESYDRERRHGLRLNQLKDHTEMPFALEEKVPWWPDAYCYSDAVAPGRHPFHAAGAYYIQEPSAMAPVSFLDVRPGMKVLDLCAAPGGKTTQIGGCMAGKGLLVCNEIHPMRAKILSENIERLGISNAVVTNADPDRLADHFPGFFHRILVDAPCSGEGMFVKNQEEATTEWSPENVKLCAQRQDTILEAAHQMLAYGGRLVYSTCTFAPDEDEGSIARFLMAHEEYTVIDVLATSDMEEELKQGLSCGRPEWAGDDVPDEVKEEVAKTIRLWPHKMKGEGHYLAVLQKGTPMEWSDPDAGAEVTHQDTDAAWEAKKGKGKKAKQKSGKKKSGSSAGNAAAADASALVADFCQKELQMQSDLYQKLTTEQLTITGEQVYLIPKQTPVLNGLKVLRPGLHVGTVKKNRFEPAHALSHAVKPMEAVHVISYEADSMEVAKYLRGETLNAEGESGWYLVCAQQYPLGWAKMTNGILKNHYPKGLRSMF